VRSMRRTFISRSLRSGHGDIDERALPPNTLIAYAQKAGITAEDGDGADSPYTTALLKHLATPGLDIELVLRRVRDEVLKATRNRQEPFKYGSLGGAELPLVPAPASPPAPTPVPSAAEREWQDIKDTKDVGVLEAFIGMHKADPQNAVYVRLAEARVEELKKTEVGRKAREEWLHRKEIRAALVISVDIKCRVLDPATIEIVKGPRYGTLAMRVEEGVVAGKLRKKYDHCEGTKGKGRAVYYAFKDPERDRKGSDTFSIRVIRADGSIDIQEFEINLEDHTSTRTKVTFITNI
jgi:hypothetical protein